MTLLSWDIPLISFNGSLWDVLLRCSKWLLGRGLIASQWSWDADWSSESNEPAPLSLWHCDPELCSIEKRFSSQWGNFGTLLPPRGASFTPLCGMFLQSPSASSNVANFTFLRNPLSELWVCEFWLLRWSTMVARAWPVCVEVIQDWLLAAPSQTSPPSCFYDTSILRYPLISFNGSLWDVLLRCSKWLLWAWLDSFTMIWDADWSSESNEPAPLSLWHCDPELCSIEKRFNWKGRPISWAVLHHWKSMGQILVPSCPPGVQLLPHFEVWSYRACQPLQMWQISHFCEIHSLSYEASIFFAMLSQWGKFGTLLPPRGATFTPFWGMVLQSLPASWNVANFTFLWNPLSELRGVKVFLNVKSMRLILAPILPLGQTSYPRSLIKVIAHDSPIRPHVLTPHSWLCDKNCGRSSAPK